MANLKLYLDEDSRNNRLLSAVHKKGFSAVSSSPELGWDDDRQLEEAIKLERTLFTFNIGDFSAIHKRYIEEVKTHYGIIVAQQEDLKSTLRKLFLLLETLTPHDMLNHIEYLSSWKR